MFELHSLFVISVECWTPLPICRILAWSQPAIESGTSSSQFRHPAQFFPRSFQDPTQTLESCWALPDIGFIHRQPILNCQYWFIRRMRRCHMGYESQVSGSSGSQALWSIVKLQFCRWRSGIHCQRWTWARSKWAWDFT